MGSVWLSGPCYTCMASLRILSSFSITLGQARELALDHYFAEIVGRYSNACLGSWSWDFR